MLREERCNLIISPRPPEGADIMQKRLFEDRYRVFYDAERRAPPLTRAEYLDADHVTVVYPPQRSLDLDAQLAAQGIKRRFVVTVPGFAGVPAFLRGADLIATAPSLMRFGPFQALASVEPAHTLPDSADVHDLEPARPRRRRAPLDAGGGRGGGETGGGAGAVDEPPLLRPEAQARVRIRQSPSALFGSCSARSSAIR